MAYPVPHCSTLVMLSCSRLLSHCTSSCLLSVSVAVVAWEQMGVRGIYRDSPILNEGCCVCVCGRVRIGERKAGDRKRTMHCACVV